MVAKTRLIVHLRTMLVCKRVKNVESMSTGCINELRGERTTELDFRQFRHERV